MLEKIIVAVTLTFSLHLLLGDRVPSPTAMNLQQQTSSVTRHFQPKTYQ